MNEQVILRELMILSGLEHYKRRKSSSNRRPAWGRLANLAGSRQIWHLCLQSNSTTCLVLEDDVDFTLREAQVLRSFLSKYVNRNHTDPFADVSYPWDVLHLGLSPWSEARDAATATGEVSQWGEAADRHREMAGCSAELDDVHDGSCTGGQDTSKGADIAAAAAAAEEEEDEAAAVEDGTGMVWVRKVREGMGGRQVARYARTELACPSWSL